VRKIEIIQATEGEQGEVVTAEYRIRLIPYAGLSRGFGEFMEKTWHLVEPCEWVMWQPADIEINYDELLEACNTAPGDFWALSLTKNSPHSHEWTVNNGKGWRSVPIVDLSPVYRYDFAVRMAPNFALSKSGWGLDILFAHHAGAWVCDDYQMKHTKPLNSQNWLIDGKSPMDELQYIKSIL
jgi:hypothetical protein